MNIEFVDREVRRLCEDAAAAQKRFGKPVAKKLQTRLNELAAAANLAEIVFGTPHPLKGNFSGCIGIWLDGANRLVIRPADDPLPTLPSGGIDPARVTIVRIEFIGDYHG